MMKMEVIMIPVADQQRAKEFYVRMGFRLIAEAPMGNGETWVQLALPGSDTSISLAGFHGIVLEVDNIESTIHQLAQHGQKTGDVDHTPAGKFSWMADVDGNKLCLHEKQR